jgi:hypothetical protein
METNNMDTKKAARLDTNEHSLVHPNFEPYIGKYPYIFVSYAHSDNNIVNPLMNTLSDEKFRIWFDAGLEVGNDFREELIERIRNCYVMVFFASEKSLSSKYCSTEIINAYKFEKKIFPFFLGDANSIGVPSQLEMIIGNIHHIHYDNTEKSIKLLMDALPKQTMHALQIDNDGIITKCKDGNSSIAIPDIEEGKKITAVGDEAFRLCLTLEEITFGSYVKSIGKGAFRSCTSLKDLLIPETVDIIEENAFRDCIKLEKLVLERNVDIFDRAFENCPGLHSITFPDDFSEINNAIFNSCKGLTEINLPDSVVMIGESAFADCTGLQRIVIPSGTIKINDFAFSNCASVKEIVFNSALKKIGKNAFQHCTSLHDVFLPRSLSLIENGAFKGCEHLEKIEVDPRNKYYRSFNNVLFTKNKSELLTYAPNLPDKSYDVPDSVMKICDNAFYGCKHLKEINIPDSVQVLGEGAFFGCSNIETVIIPDSVKVIEDHCFRNCTNLRRVVVPDSILESGWGIFRGCSYGFWKKEGFELTVVCSNESQMAKFCDEKGIKHITN